MNRILRQFHVVWFCNVVNLTIICKVANKLTDMLCYDSLVFKYCVDLSGSKRKLQGWQILFHLFLTLVLIVELSWNFLVRNAWSDDLLLVTVYYFYYLRGELSEEMINHFHVFSQLFAVHFQGWYVLMVVTKNFKDCIFGVVEKVVGLGLASANTAAVHIKLICKYY